MDYVKKIGIAIVVALALAGSWALYTGAANLYGDWLFVRQQRIVYIQNLQRQQQQQAAQQAAPRQAPVAPVAPAK